MIVGAVQSGKTASMIGLAATALDEGYKIIVVLAGSKDDLRQQTARRFNTQLLLQSDPVPGNPTLMTLPAHIGDRPLGGFAPPYSLDSHQYSLLWIKMSKALRNEEPVVIVVKKNPASLADIRSKLLAAYDLVGGDKLPTLILDDECDDASVNSEEFPIPSAIANLWHRSGSPLPRVVYLGYTATAAANLLQPASNDLYPQHFVSLLRYPSREGTALSYSEPSSDSWYIGGDTFYQEFGESPGDDENFLIREVEDAEPENSAGLTDALRAYLISGAFRLALTPGCDFMDSAHLPDPHTMIVQTSPFQNEHLRWADAILSRWGGARLADSSFRLDGDAVMVDVNTNESAWRAWFDSFDSSRQRMYLERPHETMHRFVTWTQVKDSLPVVLDQVRVRIVNSDPGSGSGLDFERRTDGAGISLPPPDLYTIIVGGSRLSRGLTIEGLCISYFTRWNPSPTEDTVLQLARWFGYRGHHLEFCRLFTTRQIYESLREMHQNDTDLRHQLAELMFEHARPEEAALILRASPHARPTAKMGIGKLHDLAFSPFETVFRNVECGDLAEENQNSALSLVTEIRARGAEEVRTQSGGLRGIVSRSWTIDEVADLLDSLVYSDHNPGEHGNPSSGDLHKAPDAHREVSSGRQIASDPYQAAAYLRSWSRQIEQAEAPPPSFNVAVAFGEITEHTEPFDFGLLNRAISNDCRLESNWTGRSASWPGDAFFDQPDPSLVVSGSALRRAGAEGLLLLYIIHRNATGRKGRGIERDYHTPTFGIVIPAGGPRIRRVTVDQRGNP